MSKDDFRNAALVLVGHGSTQNAESAASTYQHARELRRRAIFGEVREAFCKQEPNVVDQLETSSASRVFVVPLFVSEGYFTDKVIPDKLGFREAGQARFPRVRRRQGQMLYYCGPIGTHESMIDVILDQARGVMKKHPFPRQPETSETALVIAGHGTPRHDNSRAAMERAADLIRSRNLFAEVHAAFIEEEPQIAQCYRLARSRSLVVVPFFMSDGLHAREDIPILLGEPKATVRERLKLGQAPWSNPTERQGKLVWYASTVGTAPGIADVILERVRQSLGPEVVLNGTST